MTSAEYGIYAEKLKKLTKPDEGEVVSDEARIAEVRDGAQEGTAVEVNDGGSKVEEATVPAAEVAEVVPPEKKAAESIATVTVKNALEGENEPGVFVREEEQEAATAVGGATASAAEEVTEQVGEKQETPVPVPDTATEQVDVQAPSVVEFVEGPKEFAGEDGEEKTRPEVSAEEITEQDVKDYETVEEQKEQEVRHDAEVRPTSEVSQPVESKKILRLPDDPREEAREKIEKMVNFEGILRELRRNNVALEEVA